MDRSFHSFGIGRLATFTLSRADTYDDTTTSRTPGVATACVSDGERVAMNSAKRRVALVPFAIEPLLGCHDRVSTKSSARPANPLSRCQSPRDANAAATPSCAADCSAVGSARTRTAVVPLARGADTTAPPAGVVLTVPAAAPAADPRAASAARSPTTSPCWRQRYADDTGMQAVHRVARQPMTSHDDPAPLRLMWASQPVHSVEKRAELSLSDDVSDAALSSSSCDESGDVSRCCRVRRLPVTVGVVVGAAGTGGCVVSVVVGCCRVRRPSAAVAAAVSVAGAVGWVAARAGRRRRVRRRPVAAAAAVRAAVAVGCVVA